MLWKCGFGKLFFHGPYWNSCGDGYPSFGLCVFLLDLALPSCWTWPLPKPYPLWTDSKCLSSRLLIAILQTAGGWSCASMQRGMLSLLDPRGCGAEMEERRGSTWCRPGSWGHLATVLLAYWVSRLRSTTISCIHLVSYGFMFGSPASPQFLACILLQYLKFPPTCASQQLPALMR